MKKPPSAAEYERIAAKADALYRDERTINIYCESATTAALVRAKDPEATFTAIHQLGITVDLFAHPPFHRAIQAIGALIESHTPIDLATLSAHLDHADLAVVDSACREHVSAANLPEWVKILKGCHRRRRENEIRDKLSEAATAGAPDHELAAIVESIRAAHCGAIEQKGNPPPFRGFDEQELTSGRLHPKCIVENHLYADLALLAAAGGTGKTTVLIHEAVCIALGRDLWGCRVVNPGSTLFVTAEDSRDLFAARLREIMRAMGLSESERLTVRERIEVWDVSGDLVRLAELDEGGNIRLTDLADRIVSTYRGGDLVQVVFDPAISFGPGERIVNDGEQAVVTACRRIVRGLDCCVRLNHHTGKVNARNGALDQYAGRGGTALPDGCRMVAILSVIGGESIPQNPPDGFELQPGESGFIMARPKLSYAPPQPNIWIRRRGWTFEYFTEIRRTSAETLNEDTERVANFIADELTHGRKHTARTLDGLSGKLGLTRTRLRAALANLQVNGRLYERDLPDPERRGRRKTYLYAARHCAEPDGAIEQNSAPETGVSKPIAPNVSNAPPYRERKNGAIDRRPSSSPLSECAEPDGAIAAQWRNSEKSDGILSHHPGNGGDGLAMELATAAGLDLATMMAGNLDEAGWARLATASAQLSERQPDHKAGLALLVAAIDRAGAAGGAA